MFSRNSSDHTNQHATSSIDQAVQSAEQALHATQRAAHDALEGFGDGVQQVRRDAAPVLTHAVDNASALAQRGLNAVKDGTHRLQDQARHASDSTARYIRDEPVKAMLIAAASGAALMVLMGWVTRSRDRR
ncbi:hypothetical protein [Ideonella sp. A 288]|uniref:hypothetical protein n=1 Tax=Ideonella sp. A 288 TaxID=1962181 RepID=UPI000B4AAD6C|nr:hypothetical protein [Ideonella sp. A 288]